MAMINRATGRAPKSADAFLPGMKTWSDNTADKWYYLDVQEATNSHDYTWDINILTYSDHNGIFKAFIENLKNPVTERWTYIKK